MPRRRYPRRHRRPVRRSRPRAVFLFCLLLIGLFSCFLFFAERLRPVIREYAESRAVNLAAATIHEAVQEELSEGNISYQDLIHLEKDTDGRVTALHTNIVNVNQLKAGITAAVIDRLSAMDTSDLAIPLGTISGVDLFTGFGPRLKVGLVPLGKASAAFGSRFTSAGINQTRHSIVMEVSVTITILLPGEQIQAEVASTVDVAETVIVGVVPDSYTNVEDPNGETTDLIFDYAQ